MRSSIFYFPHCRNETEVESKLIVDFLLPSLGYTPNTWYQEVVFGRIRLDFLVFAVNRVPLRLADHQPVGLVIEAKSPQLSLDRFEEKLQHYLEKLRITYGVLTNGRDFRVYQLDRDCLRLRFRCGGEAIEENLPQIQALIGRETLINASQGEPSVSLAVPLGAIGEGSERQELEATAPSSDLVQPDSVQLDRSPASQFVTIYEDKDSSMIILAIYHNKGGVGKTTTTVNLAATLSKMGYRVLLIDLDSQSNSTFAVGLMKFRDELDDDIKKSYVYHVILEKNKFSISEVARKSSFCTPEFDVIPSHIDLMTHEFELREGRYITKTRLLKKLEEASGNYDIVLIDTPPSLNLYAEIALITADYLLIPSDLKPFANEGLNNVRNFINDINEDREDRGRSKLEVLGVLPSKIATHARFVDYTLPKMEKKVEERYGYKLLNSRIYDRRDASAAIEKTIVVGDLDIPDPQSVLDFKPDSASALEFRRLAEEVISLTGL